MPPVASPNFQPPSQRAYRVFSLGKGRSGPNVVYTRPDESHLLCGKKPVIALGDILPRIAIVAVPSGLGTREGACVAVATGGEIEDGVDRGAATADSDHDRVLVGTHDICDAVEHCFLW